MPLMECCARPTGAECHCAACHQTFSHLSLFVAHQDVDYARPRERMIVCRSPAALGLAASDRGVWHTPAGLKQRQIRMERLARAHSREAAHVRA